MNINLLPLGVILILLVSGCVNQEDVIKTVGDVAKGMEDLWGNTTETFVNLTGIDIVATVQNLTNDIPKIVDELKSYIPKIGEYITKAKEILSTELRKYIETHGGEVQKNAMISGFAYSIERIGVPGDYSKCVSEIVIRRYILEEDFDTITCGGLVIPISKW